MVKPSVIESHRNEFKDFTSMMKPELNIYPAVAYRLLHLGVL